MLKSQLEQQSKAVDTIVGNMRVLENKLAEVRRCCSTFGSARSVATEAHAFKELGRHSPRAGGRAA